METPENFLGLEPEFCNIESARYALVSIPFDKSCSWQRGTSKGPRAVLEASRQVELYDVEYGNEPYKAGVFTAPAVEAETSQEMVQKGEQAVASYLERDKFVFTIGGDHSISLGPIKAHHKKFPKMSVLHIDAHVDRRAQLDGNIYSHASIIARTAEFVSNIVSVGIRSGDKEECANLNPAKMFYAHQLVTNPNWIKQAIAQLDEQVYITLDVDAFDIGIMPSTGTPEPGGMGWYEVLGLIKAVIKERELVGMDIVELLPNPTNLGPDFLVAKLIYKVINLLEQN